MVEQKRSRILVELLYFMINAAFWLYVMSVYGSWTELNAVLFVVFASLGGFLCLMIPPLFNRLVMFLYGGVFTAYLVTQGCYQKAFRSYYRFNTAIDLFSEVEGVASSALEFVGPQEILTVGLFIFIVLFFTVLYFVLERTKTKYRRSLKEKLLPLVCLVPAVLCGLRFAAAVKTLPAEAEEDELFSDQYVYEMIPNANLFVERFGLLTYAVRDTASMFTSQDEFNHERIQEFLAARSEQYESQFHGLFAGKNVMFIQAESFNHVMLDPDLTPTLYKMYKQGLVIENFNTPALPGSTSDTEFMANVSLIPNNDGHAVCYLYGENVYKTTLPNLFSDHGYKTAAYHNNYGEYYNRDITMYTFGYDHFLDCTDFGMMDTPPDSDVMEVMKYIYSEETMPWMAFWITFSGHQPYTYGSTGVKDEYVAQILRKYPDLSEPYVAFYAKNMDLDRSIGALMHELQVVGKLDDTVFVFFGDHIVKGLDFDKTAPFYKETGIKYTGDEYNTDLYFYCSDMEKRITYKKCATILDLMPTVADLWGFDIDMHTVLGRNIFDPDYRGFYFSEWDDWETDHYTYRMSTNEFTFGHKYDLNTAKKEIMYFIEEKDVSKEILASDYFADGHSHRHEYTEEELEDLEQW